MKSYKVIFTVERIIQCNSSSDAVNTAREDITRSDYYDYVVYELTSDDLKLEHNIELMNK